MTTSAFEQALALASKGVPVFPCRSNKAPACPNGFKAATTDPDKIRQLWESYSGQLIGVPTGRITGWDVLDIDPKNGGDKWLNENADKLPKTCTHKTRSGGYHYFFRHHSDLNCNASKVAIGVDVRADNGYVIWWPATGLPTSNDSVIASWPDWLLKLAISPQSKYSSPLGGARRMDFDTQLQQAIDTVANAPEGTRNDTLNRQTFLMGRQATVIDAMEAAGEAAGLSPEEVQKTIASAIRGAGTKPIIPSIIRPAGGVVDLIRGDQVELREIDWLWKDWLAKGKFHILAGMPGTGKTTIALSLAATVTSGSNFPDNTKAPEGDILIWSGEDDPSDTLAPRLMAMGANMVRVHFINGVKDGQGHRPFDPATDLTSLSAEIEKINPAMLIVDPIVSAVNADSHKNTETRRALQPIVDLAIKSGMAVLGISHFSKGSAGRNPVERVIGSLAFAAMARVIFIAAKQEKDEGSSRIFCRAKSNIGPDDDGFSYALRDQIIPERLELSPSCVVWGNPIEGSAKHLLAEAENMSSSNCLEDAKDFLEQILGKETVSATEIRAASKQAGISNATLRRAKDALGVASKRDGKNKTWAWALPQQQQDAQDAQL